MNQNSTKTKKSVKDDEYADAIQPVVDEAMRIDNLAPNVLNAVQHDVSLRNEIQNIAIETIQEKQPAKEAVNDIIEQNKMVKHNKWTTAIISTIITIVLTLVVTWAFNQLTNNE